MGRLASLIVAILVLVGLGAYIYFVESRRRPAASAEKVFRLEPEQIAEIRVRNESEVAWLRKIDQRWRLVEPEEADADARAVETLASALASIEIVRVVEDNASDLAEYGLAPAPLEIAFKRSSEENFQQLLIGTSTPGADDVYATIGRDRRVLLVPGYFGEAFNVTPFSLRDKSILSFDRAKVTQIELATASGVIRLAKNGGVWNVTQPVEAPAASRAVDQLLDRVQNVPMISIVAREVEDVAHYGLDTPRARLTITSGGESASLAIGGLGKDGLYARQLPGSLVFTVETSLLDDLSRPASHFYSQPATGSAGGSGPSAGG
jgi:hypothetical protein